MKLAVFLPNWIGDVVMATPALRGLREHFARAEIVAVGRPYVAEVLAGTNLVDRMIFHDPRGKSIERRGWRFLRQLRQERFDTAVLFPNSIRSGFVAWCSGAKRRLGFARDGRGWLLTDGLTPKSKQSPHPVLDEYLRLAAHLGCENLNREMVLGVTDAEAANFSRILQKLPQEFAQRGYVALNSGGAFGAAKHWPSEHLATLARRIASENAQPVLVLCGPAERDAAREVVARAGHPLVTSLADESLSIGLTKAAVKNAKLLVTTDSGPRHFAAPFGVPVVALFGPTHIAWSETYYSRETRLQLAVDCGPCQQRSCPQGHHRCMRDLSPDMVFEQVVRLLPRSTPSEPEALAPLLSLDVPNTRRAA